MDQGAACDRGHLLDGGMLYLPLFLESLADFYATPARQAELIAIFKKATRLEADFWEMGWRADQHVR